MIASPIRANPRSAVVLLLLVAARLSAAATHDITGFVRDAGSGEALPYASVIIKGKRIGVITDPRGRFTIINAPAAVCTLEVRL